MSTSAKNQTSAVSEKVAMDPVDIQAAITKCKGWNMTRIAKKVEKSPSFVRDVIYSRRRSIKVARFIAKLINKPVDQIWADEYDEPTARQLSLKEAREQRQSEGQKEAA